MKNSKVLMILVLLLFILIGILFYRLEEVDKRINRLEQDNKPRVTPVK